MKKEKVGKARHKLNIDAPLGTADSFLDLVWLVFLFFNWLYNIDRSLRAL